MKKKGYKEFNIEKGKYEEEKEEEDKEGGITSDDILKTLNHKFEIAVWVILLIFITGLLIGWMWL